LSTIGLWHYPATITDPSIAIEFAQFAPSDDGEFNTTSTAAIINTFGSREQMVWFTSWGTDWAETSNFIMHAHIHWMTRGLCKFNNVLNNLKVFPLTVFLRCGATQGIFHYSG
jgi:hypothetical protein